MLHLVIVMKELHTTRSFLSLRSDYILLYLQTSITQKTCSSCNCCSLVAGLIWMQNFGGQEKKLPWHIL